VALRIAAGRLAGERGARTVRTEARGQHPVDHGRERLRLDREAELRQDRLRRGVRLERRETGLLERERRGVARREHAGDTGHPPVPVDRDEARIVPRQTGDVPCPRPRQCDDMLGSQDPPVGEAQLAVARLGRGGPRHEIDAPVPEEPCDERPGARPEQCERLRLRGHDRDLVAGCAGFELGRRPKRELVERHGPRQRRTHDEREAGAQPPAGRVEDAAQAAAVGRAAQRHGARHRVDRLGPDGDEEAVVRRPDPRARHDRRARRVDRRERVADQRDALLGGEALEPDPPRSCAAERLGHRDRPTGELRMRREQVDAELGRGGVRPQAQARLERGDAAARDEHARWARPGIRP
jgi:hypothetical protein